MNAIDTNILVYALDLSEPDKGAAAVAFLETLSHEDTILPWQVLCEFASVLLRLDRQGRCAIDRDTAIASARARFPTVMPDPTVLDGALRLHREHQIQFWDAVILASCAAAGVDRLFSEDLPSSPSVVGIRVVNPFAST